MKIGFTGTQIGCTVKQCLSLLYVLKEDGYGYSEFHHGDCIGADADASVLAGHLNFKLIAHPPIIETKRAFCKVDEIRPAYPYLERNHHIVDECEFMIACPKEKEEQLRSGTWATVRYAKKQKKRVILVFPDGEINYVNPV